MGTFTIEYSWYNPRNPRCRCCKYWDGNDIKDYHADCTNEKFKGDRRCRAHNAKACTQFSFRGYEERDTLIKQMKEGTHG